LDTGGYVCLAGMRRSLIDPPLRPPLAEPRISTAVRNDGVGLDKPNANSAHPMRYNQSRIKRRQPVRALSSKLWLFVSVLLVAFALFAALSRKYFWLYATRRADPPRPASDLLGDASTSNNPEVLLEKPIDLHGCSIGQRQSLSTFGPRTYSARRATLGTKYTPALEGFVLNRNVATAFRLLCPLSFSVLSFSPLPTWRRPPFGRFHFAPLASIWRL